MKSLTSACFARMAICATLCLGSLAAAAAPPNKDFDYYLTGNEADVTRAQPATSATVLMGGGTDVDAAFQWMIAKAGGGDFVVVRATGADGYNTYLYDMGGVDSVETLVIKTRAGASNAFVIDKINQAEMIFIAGGDQSDYINLWKGTPVETALRNAMARKVPIGGTSAGMAVLGQFDFAALNGTVTSKQALSNPYDHRVTLDQGFLTAPSLNGVIGDPHFVTRDRMGRLLTFMARTLQDAWVSTAAARGIGVDEETALLIDDGVATRVGAGSAYFLRPLSAPLVCAPKQPLTFRDVQAQRLSGAAHFDLGSWSSPEGGAALYYLSVEAGVVMSSQPGGGIY